MVDNNRLSQVLINLISNAIKFSCEDDQVAIIVESCPFSNFEIPDVQRVLIKIIDNGIGIEQDEIDHLFEPSFKTKNLLSQ